MAGGGVALIGKTVKEVQVENGVVTNCGSLFLLAKNEKMLILANRNSIISTYC